MLALTLLAFPFRSVTAESNQSSFWHGALFLPHIFDDSAHTDSCQTQTLALQPSPPTPDLLLSIPVPAGAQCSCFAQIIQGAYFNSKPNVACVFRRLFEVLIFMPRTFKGRVIKCI